MKGCHKTGEKMDDKHCGTNPLLWLTAGVFFVLWVFVQMGWKGAV